MAVIFVTKIENGESHNEGLCLKCAKEMGLKPVEDMMQKMGISDEDLEGLTNEMMTAFGGAEGLEGLMENASEDPDGEEDDEGRTATFPFLNKLFGGGAPVSGDQSPKKEESPARPTAPVLPSANSWKITASHLTQKAAEGKLDRIIGRDAGNCPHHPDSQPPSKEQPLPDR